MSDDRHRELERARNLMMAALDDELGDGERNELEGLLSGDPELKKEWDRMSKLKEVTGSMGYREPPPEFWDEYWTTTYRRVERSLGWVLFSVGTIVLTGYGLWRAVAALLTESDAPLWIRIALFSILLGGAVLVISAVREKWFTYRRDPYKGVRR